MSFCYRIVPCRIDEQAMSALVEVFLQTKLVTVLGIDPVKFGIDLIRFGADPVRAEIFYKIFS